MEKYYLFVHFRETRTPEGEQVYFGVSKGGFIWESLNDQKPILQSDVGEKGVRDFTITRTRDNGFVILATDLSLAHRVEDLYGDWPTIDWPDIVKNGSHCLVKWTSKDLIHWSQAELVQIVDENYGCAWAPDVIYVKEEDAYMVHWTSPTKDDDYKKNAIYYSFTKDFKVFTQPCVLYMHPEYEVIDSCIVKENGKYYCFIKLNGNTIRLLVSDKANGDYIYNHAFEDSSKEFNTGMFEAPTAFRLPDGRWSLMIDYYGAKEKEGHGYVPFVSEDIDSGIFRRSDEKFSFPYGYKHGTVLEISRQEYDDLIGAYGK